MRRLLFIALLASVLFVLPQASLADCDYTHGELVDHLVAIGNLQGGLPKDIARRSADEAYLIKLKLLLSKGYPIALDGFERVYIIDRGYFVSMVYDSMLKKANLKCLPEDAPDKTDCLKEKGYLPKDIETRLCKECQSVTHGELIDLIIKFAGLRDEIEREIKGKNADEKYRAEVAYLLSLAFPRKLDGYTRQFMITRGYFAEVVYDIFRDRLGCPATTTKEKAQCLVRAGYLSTDDLARTLCRDEVIVTLSLTGYGEFRKPTPHDHPVSPVY
jgi:hypothetical protein